jgi:translation initiation factor 4E
MVMEAAAVNDENRHPLESSWDLWYLSADKSKDWDHRLTRLMTFQTVEDFWALYHHVQLPSKLPVGSDYMLFKTGIQPKWEDKKNEDGGKWTIETARSYRHQLDSTWLETLLAVIGEGKY